MDQSRRDVSEDDLYIILHHYITQRSSRNRQMKMTWRINNIKVKFSNASAGSPFGLVNRRSRACVRDPNLSVIPGTVEDLAQNYKQTRKILKYMRVKLIFFC